jgi:hypothetical protein
VRRYTLIVFLALITGSAIWYYRYIQSGDDNILTHDENSMKMRWKNAVDEKTILFSKNVKWGGFEDGSGPSLEHENWIVLGKSDLTIDDLHKWERGKLLTLAYSRSEGVMLVDPVTSKSVRLLNMKSEHPIDGYLKQELDKPEACTTQGMVEAYDRAYRFMEA